MKRLLAVLSNEGDFGYFLMWRGCVTIIVSCWEWTNPVGYVGLDSYIFTW